MSGKLLVSHERLLYFRILYNILRYFYPELLFDKPTCIEAIWVLKMSNV